MNILNRKYILLLAAFFFAASAAFDPLAHDYLSDELSEQECHFCNNEVSNPVQLDVFFAEASLFGILEIENEEYFLSPSFNNFQSRAPPIYKA
jgi:hypothetical protein